MAVSRLRGACLLLALAACAHGFDVEGGASKPGLRPAAPGAGPPLAQGQRQGGGRSAVQQQNGIQGAAAKMSKWYRTYQSFVAAAAKVSQLISFCCGVWLVLSMPLSLVASSVMLRFDEAALIVYLALYGLLMLGMELPLGAVQRVLQQYFFFAYTRPGRGAFVVHVAVVAWACKHVGFMTKALMGFNALLTFYILNSQDRRFAAADAEAAAALQEAQEQMGGSLKDAMSFGKMFSGAFGSKFGGGNANAAPPNRRQQPAAADDGFGDFSAGAADSNSGEPSAWPGSSGGGGGGA